MEPTKLPSSKVVTGLVVAILAGIATTLAADTSWLDLLPEWAAVIAGPLIGALAAYFRTERRPTA